MSGPDTVALLPDAWATPASDLREKKSASEVLARGSFLTLRRDAVVLPDGGASTREYILHPGAVVIVAWLDDAEGRKLVVEWQYRYPVEQAMLEFPAGKLDPGERQIDCAARELREETGFVAAEWAPAGVVYPAIGYSTEFIGIWFARGLRPGDRSLDAGEFLEVRSSSIEDLLQACADGRVTDGKTLACIVHLQNLLSGRWQPEWHDAAYWQVNAGGNAASPRVPRSLQGPELA